MKEKTNKDILVEIEVHVKLIYYTLCIIGGLLLAQIIVGIIK